jgi:hypothetical protein
MKFFAAFAMNVVAQGVCSPKPKRGLSHTICVGGSKSVKYIAMHTLLRLSHLSERLRRACREGIG